MILGAKILRADGSSLRTEGRVTYPLGEWVDVPGNGAYVCVNHGAEILSGGGGAILVVLECEEPTVASDPAGVTCYRRVRRLTKGVDPAGPLAEYDRVSKTALVEYVRVQNAAWAKYEWARDAALAEYVRDDAWAECAKVLAPAQAEYVRVLVPAWAEYERSIASAWAEILRGLMGQCGVLE